MSRHDDIAAAVAEAEARGVRKGLAHAAAMLRNRAVTLAKDAARIRATGQHISAVDSLAHSASIYTIAADAVAEMVPAALPEPVQDAAPRMLAALMATRQALRLMSLEDGSMLYGVAVKVDAAIAAAEPPAEPLSGEVRHELSIPVRA